MCVAKKIKQCLWAVLFLVLQSRAGAQGCPENIGFETGNFTKWQTLAGVVNGPIIKLDYTNQPIPGIHTLYKKTNVAAKDPYGEFPIHSPISSGYSVQLGNGSGEMGPKPYTIPLVFPQTEKISTWYIIMQLYCRTQVTDPRTSQSLPQRSLM
jgi:hypothetical protein